jgi:hypothetical protein
MRWQEPQWPLRNISLREIWINHIAAIAAVKNNRMTARIESFSWTAADGRYSTE